MRKDRGWVACLITSIGIGVSTLGAGEVETFAEVAKLLRPDPFVQDNFGYAVALEGDRLVVGMPQIRYESPEGTAYVYERDEFGSWVQVATLEGSGNDHTEFGRGLSLQQDRLAVATSCDVVHGFFGPPMMFVFDRDADGNWIESARLEGPVECDKGVTSRFGEWVSLDGGTLVVSAEHDDVDATQDGSAYVFELDTDGKWRFTARLDASDGNSFDYFGEPAVVDGNLIAVQSNTDEFGQDSSSVYLFERDLQGQWTEMGKLIAPDGSAGDGFGNALSLEGNRMAIAAVGDDDNGLDSGSVYIYERDLGGVWSFVTKLVAEDETGLGRSFGQSLSLDGDRLAVSADEDVSGEAAGVIYLFERDAVGDWKQLERLVALDGQPRDGLGESISLDGNRMAAGAPFDGDGERIAGSVYVFESVLVSPEFTIAGSCPGLIQLDTSGITPRSKIALFNSSELGSGVLEGGPCDGTELGIATPNLLLVAANDFDANGSLSRTVDESICGTFLQVLDERTCLASGVVQVPLADRGQ